MDHRPGRRRLGHPRTGDERRPHAQPEEAARRGRLGPPAQRDAAAVAGAVDQHRHRAHARSPRRDLVHVDDARRPEDPHQQPQPAGARGVERGQREQADGRRDRLVGHVAGRAHQRVHGQRLRGLAQLRHHRARSR